jgi:hypothetical protein
MPFSIHSNEPSPLNSTTMGYWLNSIREMLTTDPANNLRSRIHHAIGIALSSMLVMPLEGLSNGFLSIINLDMAQNLPHRHKKMCQENLKASLIAFKTFFVAINPLSLVTLVSLSLLPQAYKHSNSTPNAALLERCKDHGEGLKIGSLAKLEEFSSFLDDSVVGSQINKARAAQTKYETMNTNLSFFDVRVARLQTHLTCYALGMCGALETPATMIAFICYSLYLLSISSSLAQSLLKISPESFAEKVNYLEVLTRQALTALFIFSDVINPMSQLTTLAQATVEKDAYVVPEETLQVVRPEFMMVGGFASFALPNAIKAPEPTVVEPSHAYGTDADNPFLS